MINAKDIAKQVWGASPAGSTRAPGLEPGTRASFETALEKRSRDELPWLEQIVPFTQMPGLRLLEIGCGAGFDAYAFCRSGAEYCGIDLAPQNAIRTRRHLAFFGYSPQGEHADAENLPFADGHFDVIFSNGVLHHTPDLAAAFAQAARVLKPDGTFWVIVFHKHSIFHWLSLWLFGHILNLGFLTRSFRQRLSMIEFTTSGALPLVNVYGKRQVRHQLELAGFRVGGMWVRKLAKVDLPGFPCSGYLWRWIPQGWRDFLSKRWGWYLGAQGRKEAAHR